MLRRSSLLLAGAVALGLAGCSTEPTRPPTDTIRLRIQGVVTSASDGTAVSGAAVVLGQGGHFTVPRDLAQVTTDAQGRYLIDQEVVVLRGDCEASQLWLRASAAGFKDKGGVGSSSLRPHCVGTLQLLDIELEP